MIIQLAWFDKLSPIWQHLLPEINGLLACCEMCDGLSSSPYMRKVFDFTCSGGSAGILFELPVA